MHPRPWAARVAALVTGLLLVACGSRPELTPVVASPPPANVRYSLFLIGDAGSPAEPEPVLAALARNVAAAPGDKGIVFLGDNIYPRGLPDTTALSLPGRGEAERRLQAQIDVALRTGTRAWFIPGNHDWDYMGPNGWAAVRRQTIFIDQRGGGLATLLPRFGCPGPVVVDPSPVVRLVMLDTQWWLHDFEKPEAPDSYCATDSPQEVIDSLDHAMRTAGDREVVVLGHHPLDTGGLHGGYIGWKTHLFPLREFKDWLWLPLPIVGSYYALNRQQGVSNQDVAGGKYGVLRRALRLTFRLRKPLVYASGHEHDLQVLEMDDVRWQIVSGTGIYGHVTPVSWKPNTRFAAAESGFMRLDFLASGRVRLAVIVVDSRGRSQERWSAWLEE